MTTMAEILLILFGEEKFPLCQIKQRKELKSYFYDCLNTLSHLYP